MCPPYILGVVVAHCDMTGASSYLFGMGSHIILPCSCSVMNMIIWHDYYLFSMDSTEGRWHPSSVLPLLVSFLSFIISDFGMMVLAYHGYCEDELMPILLCSPFVTSFDMSPHCCFP